jgi:hypothetical protein
MRQPEAVAVRSAVRSTRAAPRVGRSRRWEDVNRRQATEAAGRRREGAGPASQPPRAE